MLSGKLYNVDLSDTKTKIVLGVAAAGTALAVGGALYYLTSSESSTESGDTSLPTNEDAAPHPSDSTVDTEVELTTVQQADERKSAGNASFKKGDYEAAIQSYVEAAELFPAENAIEKSHCYQNMAAASEKLGKHDDVVKYCSGALKLNQKYIKALQRRAGAFEKLQKLEHSIKDWTAVCLIEGPQKSMKSGFMATSDRVLKRYGEEKAKEIMSNRKPLLPSHTVVKSALDNIHMDNFETSASPDSLSSEGDKVYLEVLTDIKAKKYESAVNKLDQSLKQEPVKFLNHVRCLRGIFAWIMVDYATAIPLFDAVISDPNSYMRLKVQSHIHRGEVYQAKGDKNRALADHNTAVSIDEDHPDPYLHRAQFYLSIEGLEQALKDLEKCISLDENFPSPWTQLVYGQYQMARALSPSLLDQVFRSLGKMVEKFPTVSDVFALYGQVLQDQRQFSAAEDKFKEAARLAPDNVTYKAHMATLKMMAENNYDEALVLLKEAIEEDPKCDFVLENLGMVYIQKQMYREALECLNKALELVKTEAEAAHLSALFIGIQCQWEVCEEYGVKPVSMSDLQDFSEMMTSPMQPS